MTKVWRLNVQLTQRRGGAEKIFKRSITGSLSVRVESYTNCCASMHYAKQLCLAEVQYLCTNPTFRKLNCCFGTEHEQQDKEAVWRYVIFSRTDIKCLLKEEDSFIIIFCSLGSPSASNATKLVSAHVSSTYRDLIFFLKSAQKEARIFFHIVSHHVHTR